jgi:hypothetical protein
MIAWKLNAFSTLKGSDTEVERSGKKPGGEPGFEALFFIVNS